MKITISEDVLCELAETDSNEYLKLLQNDTLAPEELAMVAEYSMGVEGHDDKVITILLKLVYHESSLVREGAVYGLSGFTGEMVFDGLMDVMTHDEDATVRQAAAEIIDFRMDTRIEAV
jgi:HEAT repeat protein